jgi:hypothetical protein
MPVDVNGEETDSWATYSDSWGSCAPKKMPASSSLSEELDEAQSSPEDVEEDGEA